MSVQVVMNKMSLLKVNIVGNAAMKQESLQRFEKGSGRLA